MASTRHAANAAGDSPGNSATILTFLRLLLKEEESLVNENVTKPICRQIAPDKWCCGIGHRPGADQRTNAELVTASGTNQMSSAGPLPPPHPAGFHGAEPETSYRCYGW